LPDLSGLFGGEASGGLPCGPAEGG
jgi:hypothetical protein